MSKKLAALLLSAAMVLIGWSGALVSADKNLGSIDGVPLKVATSSSQAVSTAVTTLVATSSCQTRILTTGAGAVSLSFSDKTGDGLTGEVGHWQAASTTVAYDANQYGCDLWRVRADVAGQVHLSEMN